MKEYYTELMLAPEGGIDVARLNEVIDNLDIVDVSDQAFLDAFASFYGYTIDQNPAHFLATAKNELRWSVEALAKLNPVDVFGAPGSEPVRILAGEGNRGLGDVSLADAVALVRGCPRLSAALYKATPTVTLS